MSTRGRTAADAGALRERILDSIATFSFSEAEARLARATAILGPRAVVARLLPPLLAEVGDRWACGEICAGQEHAISAIIRTQVGALLALDGAPRRGAPVALVATPSGERHEFGAMMAAVLASMAGWHPVYLGPDVPADQVVRVALAARARLVLLSAVALGGEALASEVMQARQGLGSEVPIVIGGAAADSHRADLDGQAQVFTLAEFERQLGGALRP